MTDYWFGRDVAAHLHKFNGKQTENQTRTSDCTQNINILLSVVKEYTAIHVAAAIEINELHSQASASHSFNFCWPAKVLYLVTGRQGGIAVCVAGLPSINFIEINK